MEYGIGDVVMSKAGRDKGVYYAVVAVEGIYVWAANGKTRSIDNPKRKKTKHIEYAGRFDETAVKNLSQRTAEFSRESKTGDSALRKDLKAMGYSNSKNMIERYLHEQE